MEEIETRLLRYFVMASDELHFSRAAGRLGISPPTLTHQIQKLERLLGSKLFRKRSTQRIELSEAGVSFCDHARAILHQLDEAAAMVRQVERGEIGRIEIGCMFVNIFDGLIADYINPFRSANPSVDITLRHLVTMEQIKAIVRNELDFGFARLPPNLPSGLEGLEVLSHPLMVAVPASHPLASAESIEPSTLRNQSFVNFSLDADMAAWRQTDAVAVVGKFAPKVVKHASNLASVLGYVSAGVGIAIVAEPLRRLNIPNVVYRPITGMHVPFSTTAFIYRKSEPSAAARAFIKHIRHSVALHARMKRGASS